jgi:NAD(P)-dependent dehydrogenase (short-subunit alcohol dehydrogenase family)
VRGACSGIGKAAALVLSDAGARAIGTSRSSSRVTSGNGVTFLGLEVTSDGSVANVVHQVIERFGCIDVLVNNAGIGTNGAAQEISVDQGAERLRRQRLRPHAHDEGHALPRYIASSAPGL